MLSARLATAAVAIPLLLALIFWAPMWVLRLVVSTLAILALVEYVGLAFSTQPGDRMIGFGLGTLLIVAAATGPGPRVFAALVLLILLGLVWAMAGQKKLDRSLSDLGIMIVGILYVGLLLPHFIWLRQLGEGPEWMTFVIATAMAGDTGGYFVGHSIGRRRLSPRVSPGKTVEGAIGILMASVLAGVVARIILLRTHSWTEMISLALAMGVLGQLGDLGESVMKRSFGAKESGWIFPGHGGVLDRIDSLLFPVCLVYYYNVLTL